LDILNKIKKAFDLKWTIYEANDILNYEGIIFSLGTKPSGLTQMTVKGRKKLLKNGGNLIFSQTYNGQILIIIKYPSVEDFIVSSEPIKQIIKVNPNEISEDFIVRQVDNFLTEMINWEKSVSSKPIGFNQKN
jgi:hypothetical protein